MKNYFFSEFYRLPKKKEQQVVVNLWPLVKERTGFRLVFAACSKGSLSTLVISLRIRALVSKSGRCRS